MNNIINRIKHLRLKPEERYLLDILNDTTEYIDGDVRYFKYDNLIIFDIKVFDTIKKWDRFTINGRTRELLVKTHGWCRFNHFWEIFDSKFNLDYVHIQSLFNKVIGEYYKLDYPIFEMDSSDTMCEKAWRFYE